MSPTVASPRRPQLQLNRSHKRARKRLRLAGSSTEVSKHNKRKHGERSPPSVRKRRPSTTPTPPPAKRVRQVPPQPKNDIEMIDPPPTKRTRKKTLKDVLRSHRINQSLKNVPIMPKILTQPPPITPLSDASNLATAVPESSEARSQCSHVENSPPPFYLTGDEQIAEIDISEASKIDHQPETTEDNPLQAHLLEDGRCFVRIQRPDGTIDYYTLHPYQ